MKYLGVFAVASWVPISAKLHAAKDKTADILLEASLLKTPGSEGKRRDLCGGAGMGANGKCSRRPPKGYIASASGEALGHPPSLCFSFDDVPHDFTLKHASYLPDPAKAVPGGCQDSSAVALRHHLERLGSPKECMAGMQLTTDNVGYGFGSVLNSWIKVWGFGEQPSLCNK